MKRCLAALLLLVLLCSSSAVAEYWPHDSSHAVSCQSNQPGCQILQMVMMGCFDYVKMPDSLDKRVLSAVLPKLRTVDDAAFTHFCEEFSVEKPVILAHYYTALANCLFADIQLNPDPGGEETLVRRVLALFLDPVSTADTQQEMQRIRSEMTDAVVQRMANQLGVPSGFIDYLIHAEAAQPDAEAQP